MNDNQIVRCPFCTFEDSIGQYGNRVYPTEKQEWFSDVAGIILICPGCSGGFVYPFPLESSLEKFYENSEYWGSRIPKITERDYPIPFMLAGVRWDLISRHLSHEQTGTLRMLDVGAGQGFMGLIAGKKLKREFEYTTIEPDTQMKAALKKVWGTENRTRLIQYSDLNDISNDTRYDVIILSHVLEHIPNPLQYLAKLRSMLSENGIVFIDVPHSDYLYKKEVFPHLLFFSVQSLACLLKASEYSVISNESWGRDRDSFFVNAYKKNTMSAGLQFIDRLFAKLYNTVPFTIYKGYYKRYYGIGRRHPNGIWIRAIAYADRQQ